MEPVKPISEFDEDFYLETNADIASAVREGRLKSGLQHYLAHGRDEADDRTLPWTITCARISSLPFMN